MMNQDCLILLTTADVSGQYRSLKLDQADKLRLQQHPQLAQRVDWQSSRFLKQQLSASYPQFSLTHKKGHAGLIACSSAQYIPGIDMEYAQERNFLALAQLCCTANEQRWLTQQSDLSTAFYQLWTLKEALIKISRGQLTDMRQWCLIPTGYDAIHIPALNPPVQAYSCVIDQYWHISAVYPAGCSGLAQNCTYGFGRWQEYVFDWHRWPVSPLV
ncbi:4'-phosphopantetheinyl transferase family protein [Snodgrassella communis]|uniref:4'-phosphopantetheinyl transferase family protein n=1 Tax=Snodgrassella communis TaxID=2946699 RepID=UPI001EF686A9|nr:4'-phosphopantetheinyl transferase superfamily protein [Snodgrassella communis]